MKHPAIPETVDLSLILRGLFASAVVWWHTIGAYHTETISGWLNLPGRVSVWMFFGLSGYVIAHGFFSGRYKFDAAGLVFYLLRRAARILPLFWLITFTAVVLALHLGSELQVSPENLIAAFFALQWSHTTYYVGVFWTLGLELQFYIVAPAIIGAMVLPRRYGWVLGLALLLTLWATFGAAGDDRSTIANLQHFLAGIVIGWFAIHRGHWFDRIGLNGAILSGLVGAACISLVSYHYATGSFWDGSGALVADIAIALLLVCHVCVERLKLRAGAASRIAMIIGILAYGIYAWHGLILTFIPALTPSFPIVYGLSLAAAWASFILIERPVINAAKRLERKVAMRVSSNLFSQPPHTPPHR